MTGTIFWIAFFAFIFVMLALDLGVFHKTAREIRFREAVIWTIFWVFLAMIFAGVVWFFFDADPVKSREASLNFLAGYILEISLSIDNLFVFLLLFHFFRVPHHLQHTVLFWGILGVLIMRGVFIGAGLALIQNFHFVIYIFAVFLIYTGARLAFKKDEEIHPEHNPVLKLFRKFFPVAKDYHEKKFFILQEGKRFATPLLVVLVVVETTDVVFAVDSVPAVLGITFDPFIVFTSNVFAILGLRSMYFALAGFMKLFHHLHYGLSFVLVFVGVKMILGGTGLFQIPTPAALGTIALVLAVSVAASVLFPEKQNPPEKEFED